MNMNLSVLQNESSACSRIILNLHLLEARLILHTITEMTPVHLYRSLLLAYSISGLCWICLQATPSIIIDFDYRSPTVQPNSPFTFGSIIPQRRANPLFSRLTTSQIHQFFTMGCEQSTPVHGESMQIGKQVGGKDASKKRISGIGQTERLVSSQLKRQQQNQMQASNTATVSLDADEEITMRAPNLNPDGTMKAEEVVRRTSSCIETSSIALGNKEKGGKVVQVQVRGTRRPNYSFTSEGFL
jgi:hypothetical protein